MIIYQVNERVPVKVDDVELSLKPLTHKEKSEIRKLFIKYQGNDTVMFHEQAHLAIKYSLKDVSGFKMPDGSDYKLKFDNNNYLTDECVNDLLNTQVQEKLMTMCYQLLNGIPEKFMNPVSMQPIEGVEILKESSVGK